jgi:transglutaminase-like putative cysteine protease
MTYTTNGASTQNYFQVYVLNYNPGTSDWRLIRPDGGNQVTVKRLPTAPGLQASITFNNVRTTVTIPKSDGFSSPIYFLPVPYWPQTIHVKGSWREAPGTSMIYSSGGASGGLHYTVVSGDVEPTAEELASFQSIPAAIKAAYTGYNPRNSEIYNKLRSIAQNATKGKKTPFAKAVALERFFQSSQFSYSLQSGLANSPQGLLTFLTTSKSGYCQQYAFAMAVLARILGIPARVAVGYTAGQRLPNDTWDVTTADAHAWPELFFAGIGWLRFEPTPGGVGGQDTAVEPAYVSAATTHGSTGPTGPSTGPSTLPNSPGPKSRGTNIGAHVRTPSEGGPAPIGARPVSGSDAWLWNLAWLLLLMAVTPAAVRQIVRRRGWKGAHDDATVAAAAWQELCGDLDDYGQHCRASESPRAVARRVHVISDLDPAAGHAADRLAYIVERARYAPVPVAAGTARADVLTVRKSLAKCSSFSVRWRARLLPPSVMLPLRSGFRQATGLLMGTSPAVGEN